MSEAPDALVTLFRRGQRFGTIIDIGCADGTYFMHGCETGTGVFAGAVPFNVDANAIYEPSLQEIKSVCGGDYFIGAVTDTDGEVEILSSAHPYWASLRPEGDSYWQRVNGMHGSKTKVPAKTLDHLVDHFALKPPYLLKLDVQGAELQVLTGATRALRETDVVVCEADLDDFQSLNGALVDAGFRLFDLTALARNQDGMLAWFYPIYVNRRVSYADIGAIWDKSHNEAIIQAQIDRRKALLNYNAESLRRLRSMRASR